ncbi:hypothetical protein [Lacrimispora sp. 210928-DFI.3.58]|uniref:hypothetical protein n=1 Tax=Lacrimispora sp. 210928-DFI.3.58 TaxID=2883214 RepID=UPI001D07A2E5|nr:hypothetical protein [Lacrimispora sp. 210928-DFI.3.58]MCB7319924.1 hypothetical protein [Lacrimispora sp. 210928-DFI.3.58]
MTTMTIIEKCRERFQEIPELQKKYSHTEESTRVNDWKLKNLEKEYALLSKLLGVIEENEEELPEPVLFRTSNFLKEERLNAYASVPDVRKLCTGKHDLFVVSEYIEGKRPTDIAKTLDISVARVLDVLDNVKRRCLWSDKKS